MKVLLLHPPVIQKWGANTKFAHLGIAYIASFLEKNGIEVVIVDCPAENYQINDVKKIIMENNFDVLGVSTGSYNYTTSFRLTSYMKSINPKCFIIMGGYLPTLNYLNMKSVFSNVDCLVIGEGEFTILSIVNNLHNHAWKATPGIAYLDNDNIVYTGAAELIKNIDLFPYPKRIKYLNEMNIITTRGCYGRCSFCCSNGFRQICGGKKPRRRSPENVVVEISILINNGAQNIIFDNDTFEMGSIDAKIWIDRFLEIVNVKKLKFNFFINIRANDIVNYSEKIKQLMGIGLIHVYIGIESFIQKHLDLYNKKTTVEQNLKALKILNNLNLQFSFGYIMFNPFITLDEIIETCKIIKSTNLNQCYNPRPISKYELIVYQNAPIRDLIAEKGLLNNTEKGYRFENDNMELFYSLCQEWHEKIYLVYKHYKSFINIIKSDIKQKLSLQKIFEKTFLIDINFLEELANAMKDNQSITKDNYLYIIEKYHKYILPLSKELESIVLSYSD